MARWRRSPLPPGWAHLRRAILERDDHACQIRGPRCEGQANEVHHIRDHNDHSPSNLLAVCGPCHRTETGRASGARLTAWRADHHHTRNRTPPRHPGLR